MWVPQKVKFFELSKLETSAKHAILGSCGIFSDKWWVKIEWGVMSDGFSKTKQPLILTNVWCVPSFNFNLLSISQLTKTILCWLIFFGNMCFIQDLAHWSTTGLGREFKGLYLLEESLSTSRNRFSAAGFVNNLVVQPSI